MTFVVLVGCNDTFGYIVGVLLGKHPLVPKISPKKTWEGLAGSLIFTMIGGL
jgi:phosphatidate cytidylyltransferase